jgi:hypothetical protein
LVEGYKSDAASDEGTKDETCLNLSTYGMIEKQRNGANQYEMNLGILFFGFGPLGVRRGCLGVGLLSWCSYMASALGTFFSLIEMNR